MISEAESSLCNGLFISLLIVVPILFGICKRPKEMGLSIVAISAAFCFANISQFNSLKIFGLEAHLRQTIDDANEAIEQVKKLALVIAEPVVDSLAVNPQKNFIYLKDKIEQVDKIKTTLNGLKIPQKDIDLVIGSFVKTVSFDHVYRIVSNINRTLPEKDKVKFEPTTFKVEDWSSQKLRALIKDKNFMIDAETEASIEDLKFFEENFKLRRENNWQG